MLEAATPTPQAIAEANRDPAEIAHQMLDALPADPAYAPALLRQRFAEVVTPVLARLLSDPDHVADLEPAFQTAVLQRLASVESATERLLAQERDRALEFGIKEGLLIALARRYAEGNPGNFDEALAGLENALKVAAQRSAILPDTVDAAVEAVLAEVAPLNDEGQIDDAADLIAQEAARVREGLLRLYDRGIAQAVLTNTPEAAAGYEVRKIDLKGLGARFAALRQRQDAYYVKGRDAGLSFDLRVSVLLADAAFEAARSDAERGEALNDKALSLEVLGEGSADTRVLQDAAHANRRASAVRTREARPLDWAMSQNNLGNVLRKLGERSDDIQVADLARHGCVLAGEL